MHEESSLTRFGGNQRGMVFFPRVAQPISPSVTGVGIPPGPALPVAKFKATRYLLVTVWPDAEAATGTNWLGIQQAHDQAPVAAESPVELAGDQAGFRVAATVQSLLMYRPAGRLRSSIGTLVVA